MQSFRPAFALNPRLFGRGPRRVLETSQTERGLAISDDLKLFVGTFVAGFLFMSILIG
jgi:hypothetical protein